jgi:hypothetical protein
VGIAQMPNSGVKFPPICGLSLLGKSHLLCGMEHFSTSKIRDFHFCHYPKGPHAASWNTVGKKTAPMFVHFGNIGIV